MVIIYCVVFSDVHHRHRKNRIKDAKKHHEENKIENPIVIVALLGICATLFGVLAYHQLTDWRSQKERYLDVYKSFNDAFVPAVKILLQEPGTFRPDDFMKFQGLFDNQNIAMLEVRGMLKGYRLRRFNEKWQAYKEWQKDCETYEFTVMTIGIASNRQKCLALIDELLKIAKKHY